MIANRIGESIETPEELALAEEMLESASNWVRHYAAQEWTAANAPSLAVTITVAAATRGYLNPAGYLEERADTTFVKRASGWANDAKLLQDEIAALQELNPESAKQRSLQTTKITDKDRLIPRSAYPVRPYYRFGWTEPLDLREYR